MLELEEEARADAAAARGLDDREAERAARTAAPSSAAEVSGVYMAGAGAGAGGGGGGGGGVGMGALSPRENFPIGKFYSTPPGRGCDMFL